eukprot:793473-Prymnesium_polylepis.1
MPPRVRRSQFGLNPYTHRTQAPSRGYDWQRVLYGPLARPTALPRTQHMRAGCIRRLSSDRVNHYALARAAVL